MNKQDKNKEKCKNRRELIKQATPHWLTSEHHDQIKRLYTFAKELNDKGGEKYNVDHLVPLNHPLACGLHVPWNLQILSERDNKKKGNRLDVEPIPGAITVKTLVESGNMGIRYKGRFVKGAVPVVAEGDPTFTQSMVDEADFARFVRKIDKDSTDDRDFVEKSISLLMRSAKTPTELYRYLKDFAPYYQPKISNVDSGSAVDRDITIRILRPDEDQ